MRDVFAALPAPNDPVRDRLNRQYSEPNVGEGPSPEELYTSLVSLRDSLEAKGVSRQIIRGELLKKALTDAPVSVENKGIFAACAPTGGAYPKAIQKYISEVSALYADMNRECRLAHERGEWTANYDFGHTCAGWEDLLTLGVPGIIERLRENAAKHPESDMYAAGIAAFEGFSAYLSNLAARALAMGGEHPEDAKAMRTLADALTALTKRPPATFYEALELWEAYFYAYEMLAGQRLRSLGRVDILLEPFRVSDGLDDDTARRMLCYWLNDLSAMNVAFNLPFCIGGMLPDGSCGVNRTSYLIIEAFRICDIHSPKIHVRVTDDTPDDFIALVCGSIREGRSSLLFMYDNTTIAALTRCGIDEIDARNYVPIGCYEPCVMGREVTGTGTGNINLAQAVSYAIRDGNDYPDFESFAAAAEGYIADWLKRVMDFVRAYQRHYPQMYSAPLLSPTLPDCVERGLDAYENGAKYNNSAANVACVGTAADSLAMVKKYVYNADTARLTLSELREILAADWEGKIITAKGEIDCALLRREILNDPDKWGNNRELPDAMAERLQNFCFSQIDGQPNARGGVFKMGFYSIDRNVWYGQRTAATPNGRKSGDLLSKNLCASVGMDKEGATALITSACKPDSTHCANGTVIDVVLHPTAVSGEEGLNVMTALVRACCAQGGMVIHFNVFDAAVLREAQQHPERYQSLQVRVCGWNVRFVNLSRAEQDAFIIQSEQARL